MTPSAPNLSAEATLRDHARFFGSRFTPRTLAVLLGALALLRLVAGTWTRNDTLLLVAMVLLYPFYEWAVHVVVLHFKPRQIAGRTIDLTVAQEHRAHHLDPTDQTKRLSGSIRNITVSYALMTIAALILFRDLALSLDLIAFFALMALAYEWVHYLVHSNHRPRSRWLKAVRRHHLLHHYRSEHYWFGMLTSTADTVLRTSPDPTSVERSPTARTLGVEPGVR